VTRYNLPNDNSIGPYSEIGLQALNHLQLLQEYLFDFSMSCTASDISFGNNELAFLVGTKGFIMTWQDPTVSISEIGSNTGLEMNTYPNPVSGLITIEYEAENTTFIKLDIYNQLGQQVYTLFEGKQQFSFDVSDLPSGIYFCRLNVGNEVVTRKVVKL